MSYIEQFEAEFKAVLAGNTDQAAIVRWVSEKILESYRNGIAAGRKAKRSKPQGESRPGSVEKAE